MWYETPEYFFIVAVAYVAACYLDVYSSQKTSWYWGVYEANKFAADADGEFDVKKNLDLKPGCSGSPSLSE
jgi:hypothetical protein